MKTMPRLDLGSVLDAAHRRRDDPEYATTWRELLVEAFSDDGWHRDPAPQGRYAWHASALGGCIRQQVLKRAGLATDGVRMESQLTFDIGHLYGAKIAFGLMCLPEYEVLGVELGGFHPTLPLAARCDVVYRNGAVTLIDVKTESSFAKKHRRAEAQHPRTTTARPEHVLQINATALVLEALHAIRPEQGWVVYVDKESGEVDLQWAPLDQGPAVRARLEELERAWQRYELAERLPARLPLVNKPAQFRNGKMARPAIVNGQPGLCKPRSDEDARGLYCPARVNCMRLPA